MPLATVTTHDDDTDDDEAQNVVTTDFDDTDDDEAHNAVTTVNDDSLDDEAQNAFTTLDDDAFDDGTTRWYRLLMATHSTSDAAGAGTWCPWMPGTVPGSAGAVKAARGVGAGWVRGPLRSTHASRVAVALSLGRIPLSQSNSNLLDTCTHTLRKEYLKNAACAVRGCVS